MTCKNLMVTSLSKATSLAKLYENPISSFYVKLLTDEEKNRQTPGQTHPPSLLSDR